MIKAFLSFIFFYGIFYLICNLIPIIKPKAALVTLALAGVTTAALTLIVLLF